MPQCTPHTQFNVKVQSNHPPDCGMQHIYCIQYILFVAQVGQWQCKLQFRARLHYVYAGWPAGEFECRPKKHSTAPTPPFSWLQLIVELKTAQLCISVHIFSLSRGERSFWQLGGRHEVCIFSFNTSGICYLLPMKFYFLLQLLL